MRHLRTLRAALAACALWLAPDAARAYPQFTLQGLGDCGACHHSPSGGGFANRWGMDSLDVTYGEDWDNSWGNQDLRYDPTAPLELRVDLGADVRLLPIFGSDGEGAVGPSVIPMLLELGGAASLGRWIVYGSVTPRRLAGSGPSYIVASREHWIGYRAGAGVDLRIGRLVLPFGVRQPDHTQYVREDFQLDAFDQSYSFEVDYRGEDWSVFGSVFAGDLTGRPPERQERGGVLTVVRELAGGAAVGISGLGSLSTAQSRLAGSLFARSRIVGQTYVLAEVAAQRFSEREGERDLSTLADYLRLGWFVRDDMDVWLEGGHRVFLDADGLTKERVALGMNWQVLRWFEFSPQVLAEWRTGLPTRVVGLAQLHLVY